MSLQHEETLKCTKCGAENQFTIHESVNVTLNPELKPQVLNGSLFKMTCASCGTQIIVNYDILYHDMSDYCPLMIQCYHEKKGWERINDQNANIRKMMREMNLSTEFPHRVVIGYNALRETIRIFDAGYDDRVMFAVKMLFATLLRRDGVPCRGILFCGRDENSSPVFSVLNTKNEESFYNLPMDLYDNVSEKLKRILPQESERHILVDNDFMLPYLERLN